MYQWLATTASVSAVYVRHVGSVSVTIDGPKDAKWSLDGEGSSYESGHTMDSVPTGSHKVTFSEAADWTAPAVQDVTVVKDETASVSAVYVRHVGSVSVTIDGPKDAKWSLNGEGAYERTHGRFHSHWITQSYLLRSQRLDCTCSPGSGSGKRRNSFRPGSLRPARRCGLGLHRRTGRSTVEPERRGKLLRKRREGRFHTDREAHDQFPLISRTGPHPALRSSSSTEMRRQWFPERTYAMWARLQ